MTQNLQNQLLNDGVSVLYKNCAKITHYHMYWFGSQWKEKDLLRPVSTKAFILTYVKRETDVPTKNWLSGHRLPIRKSGQGTNRLSGHGLFANRQRT